MFFRAFSEDLQASPDGDACGAHTTGQTTGNALQKLQRREVGRQQGRLAAVALSGLMAASTVAAQESPDISDSSTEAPTAEASSLVLEGLQVDFRPEAMASPRYTRDLLDTPRIITILNQDLLEEQNVTDLRAAMRNVTGISLQAGEGNPPSGDQLKIRGFNARDDINVNGIRDLGNYFRDPFYVEQIEVVKGPNSAFGGRGSAGGTINFVTKKPQPEAFNRLEVSGGTDEFRRATVDINQPIDDNMAFRINLMGHSADIPGRDVADERRYGLYGAFTWGFQSDTMLTVDYLHTRQNDTPDQGLPFDRETRNDRGAATGRLPSGIDFSNFYGHNDDYRKIDVDQVGVAIEHFFSNDLALRNQTRYSRVENDSVISSPRIRTQQDRDPDNPGQGSLDGAFGIGDIKTRDQVDEAIVNQTDLLLSFDTGPVRHDAVVGFDIGRYTFANQRRPDVSGDGQRVDLLDPSNKRRTRPAVPYDGVEARLESNELGIYALNTAAFSPQWELNTGVRYDNTRATVSERGNMRGLDGLVREDVDDVRRSDEEVSYSVGLVFKPVPEASIYAATGTAFTTSATFDRDLVQLAGGPRREDPNNPGQAQPGDRAPADPRTFDVNPEKTQAYELGVKWEVLDRRLSLNAAIFRTDKSDARTPAIGDGDRVEVLDGRQRRGRLRFRGGRTDHG